MLSLDELLVLRDSWRVEGKTVVLTNGCFDVLHAGHVRYLAAARAHGDVLVVALNDDDSVRRLKGERRPLVPLADRAAILEALRAVDAVMPFGEVTAEATVRTIRPDVYVKGGDYAVGPGPGKRLPEAEIVQSYGGRVEIVSFLEGRSTTDLIAAIQERYCGSPEQR